MNSALDGGDVLHDHRAIVCGVISLALTGLDVLDGTALSMTTASLGRRRTVSHTAIWSLPALDTLTRASRLAGALGPSSRSLVVAVVGTATRARINEAHLGLEDARVLDLALQVGCRREAQLCVIALSIQSTRPLCVLLSAFSFFFFSNDERKSTRIVPGDGRGALVAVEGHWVDRGQDRDQRGQKEKESGEKGRGHPLAVFWFVLCFVEEEGGKQRTAECSASTKPAHHPIGPFSLSFLDRAMS